MIFFTGTHQPCDAHRLDRAFISIHRLEGRKSAFRVGEWICDSGSFTTILKHGGYPRPPEHYAEHVARFAGCGTLLAAVTQDFMCEPHMLERTKAGAVAARMARCGFIAAVTQRELIRIHQRWTIKRYDRLLRAMPAGVYLMPVLQGYEPADYVDHIRMYADRLAIGAWVGVGSVCKRNGDPRAIEDVLLAVKRERPDLRLHGFGIKMTALGSGLVRQLLATADSLAWSYAARREGRNQNSVEEAIAYGQRIERMPTQYSMIDEFEGVRA